MSATNFVFLLAVVTLSAGLIYSSWQLHRVRKAKIRGEKTAFDRAAEQNS